MTAPSFSPHAPPITVGRRIGQATGAAARDREGGRVVHRARGCQQLQPVGFASKRLCWRGGNRVSPIRTLEVLEPAPKGLAMQSIAVPVTLTIELHPEGADIGSLERAVSAGLAEVGERLWREIVSALEAALVVGRGHVDCGGILKANGRARRRLVTLAGEVELSRRRYRCGACGAEVMPLDAALGLEPRVQHTLGVRERALWLVTELSYARTARALDELRDLPVSHGQLHPWVKEEGTHLEAEIATRQEAVFGTHPERGPTLAPSEEDVWVQADGTMVNDRGSGTHLEVKLGLVFSGVERIGKDRRRLLDRHLVGDTGSWTTFAERFTALCAELGVYEARRILFVSDGAAAIDGSASAASPTRSSCSTGTTSSSSSASAPAASTVTSSRRRRGRQPPAMSRRSWRSCAPMPARSRRTTPSRPPAVGPSSATSRTTPGPSPTTASCRWPLRAHGEGRRHRHRPSLQDPWHELVPAWRQPSAAAAAAPSERHLGPLLGRAIRDVTASLAVIA